MKVLFIRPRLEAGGAINSIFLLGQALLKRNYHLSIATQGGDQVEVADRLQLQIHFLPLYPTSLPNLIRAVVALYKLVNQEKFDLLHSHHRFSNLVCKLVSKLTGVPVVTTVHEFKSDQRWLSRLGLGHHIITFSEAIKNHLVSQWHTDPQRISVVRMGIESSQASPRVIAQVKNQLKLQNKEIAIGCISRLSIEKGLNNLLYAIEIVKNQGRNLNCYLVGDGPQRVELEDLSLKLEINQYVHFLGWQENIPAIIANLDFLVLPSLSEGLGLVILEGLIQGKPTIGSRVGGIPEIIKHKQNGLLVPVNDPAELAHAIVHLLDHPGLIIQLGQFGRQEVISTFSIEGMVTQTEQIYHRVAKKKV